MHRTGALVVAAMLLATSVDAQTKAFGWSMKRGKAAVEGTFVVDGYTIQQIHGMMRRFCAGGDLGQFKLVGKARKKRGLVLQKFSTTCAGGPLPRFKGSRSSFEIELINKGEYKNQHLVEITTSDGAGNLLYLRETIRP